MAMVHYSVSRYEKHKNGRSYCYRKVSAYICSSSQAFVTELHSQLKKREFLPSVFRQRTGWQRLSENPHWRLQFGDKSAVKFLRWIYYEGHSLSLPRKALQASQLI
jgi:hypothetical protein